MLEKAVKNLGLNFEISQKSAYPRLPWIKMGFIIVKRNGKKKSQILKEVASELIRLST